MPDLIEIRYAIQCPPGEAIGDVCRAIALEQTVEVPEEVIRDPKILSDIVGKVLQITPQQNKSGAYEAVIGYHPEITAYRIPQLLNVLFGNISMKNFIRILDVEFPETFLERFAGPRYGIQGVRDILGVQGRPLAATALKPMGSSPERLARQAEAFALGGGDLVKDDHGLADHAFCRFEERVAACQAAIDRANEKTGRRTLYFPNVIGSLEEMEAQIEFAVRRGVRGVLLSPFLIGPDNMRVLAERFPLVVMAHPAFTGTHFHDPVHGMAPSLLLGKLFRLFGADISVFPNSGGRFGFSDAMCREIAHSLQAPLGALRPALPAPAGGMSLAAIPEMEQQYGKEAVYLIGGSLLKHHENLEHATQDFLTAIRERFESVETAPAAGMVSACELPGRKSGAAIRTHLPWREGFAWEGRQPETYKPDGGLPFSGVVRHELIGKNGEKTQFDLRYFSVAPDGFTSLEKHLHEHVIIVAQGTGTLSLPDREIALKVNDVAYVPPFAVHQLRNTGGKPFGFYCIVDHERDRPIQP